MPKDEVHLRYTGARAQGYDQHRAESDRHHREEAIVVEQLASSRPRTLLDCPMGTGRWIPHYGAVQKVIGVDRSPDMLAEARAKLDGEEILRYQFIEGSIFDRHLFATGIEPCELVLCVRFLNWVDAASAEEVLAHLDLVAARDLLVGVTVRPRGWSSPRRARARAETAMADLARGMRRRARRYVHDEQRILDRFESLGWAVEQKRSTLDGRDRVNYLYSLHK